MAPTAAFWCKDCERDVEPFDAFILLVNGIHCALNEVERREIAVTEAERFQVRSIAAKKIDEAWRSRKMVPAFPHCHNGLFPEDFKHDPSMVGKEFAARRLGRELTTDSEDGI